MKRIYLYTALVIALLFATSCNLRVLDFSWPSAVRLIVMDAFEMSLGRANRVNVTCLVLLIVVPPGKVMVSSFLQGSESVSLVVSSK